MIEQYSDLIADLEKSKKIIIKEAKEQALKIIESSNKAVEKTIRDIKEAAADKEKTKEIRKHLEEKKDEISKRKEGSILKKEEDEKKQKVCG